MGQGWPQCFSLFEQTDVLCPLLFYNLRTVRALIKVQLERKDPTPHYQASSLRAGVRPNLGLFGKHTVRAKHCYRYVNLELNRSLGTKFTNNKPEFSHLETPTRL